MLTQITAPTNEPPIRVFVARTQWTPDDPLAFVGHPPLIRPGTPDTPVYISVTFTWHKQRAELLRDEWADHYRNVLIGGPEAEKRIERVFELGFMPFCQLYQPDETKVYSEEWRNVRRKWSRPAAYMPSSTPQSTVHDQQTDLEFA